MGLLQRLGLSFRQNRAGTPPAAKSRFTETEGTYSSFGAFQAFYDGAPPELRADAYGLASAYACCEWVMRCVSVRAGKAADLLNQADFVNPLGKVEPEGGEWVEALEDSYQAFKHDVWLGWARSITLWGEAFVERIYRYPNPQNSRVRYPATVRVLNPLAVTPQIVAGQVEWFQYNDGRRMVQLPPSDVVFDTLFNPFDDVRGMSYLVSALESVNTDQSIVAYTKAFFRNNTQFGNTFTFKEGYSPTPTDWERLKQDIRENKGAQNAFRNVVYGANLEVTPPTVPDLDTYGDMQDWQKRRICSALGVPVALVDFGDARFQLSDEQRKGFYEETVIPDCNRLLHIANADILPWMGLRDYHLELNTRSIKPLLEDEEKSANILRADYQAGALSFNEYRQKRELPPKPGGDFILVPSGMMAVPVAELAQVAQLTRPQPAPQFAPPVPQPPPQLNAPTQSVDTVTLPSEAVRSKQQTPEDELKAWAKNAANIGAAKSAVKFQSYQLSGHIEHWIRTELLQDGNAKAVFDDALLVIKAIAGKTWNDIQSSFADELLPLIAKGQQDTLSRQAFGGGMRSVLRRYGLQAYRQAFLDAGVDNESFSPEELATFRAWQESTSSYISNFSSEVFKEGISEDEVRTRVELWTNKSLHDIYYQGLIIAAPSKMYQWELGSTVEHCTTCRGNYGQTKTMSEWQKIGLPQSHELECGGWKCLCRLVPVEQM